MKFLKEQVEFLKKTWLVFYVPITLAAAVYTVGVTDFHWVFDAGVFFGLEIPAFVSIFRRANERGRKASGRG